MKVYCINSVDLYKLQENNWYLSNRTVNNLYDIIGFGLIPCSKFITEEEYRERERQEKIEIVLS